jgi:hypothetical protein
MPPTKPPPKASDVPPCNNMPTPWTREARYPPGEPRRMLLHRTPRSPVQQHLRHNGHDDKGHVTVRR